MSLDCYPFGRRQTIELTEQPMAMDVAYNDNLFISVTDECQSIVVFDLLSKDSPLISKFSSGKDIVLDQVLYCSTGDYLACLGNKNGQQSIYTIHEWRHSSIKAPTITEIDVNVESNGIDRSDKLNNIDCCQRTGNLVVSCGDTILIFQHVNNENMSHRNENSPSFSNFLSNNNPDKESTRENGELNEPSKKYFEHIVSIKLNIWALKVRLLENYLSIAAVDHVQVLKLELLTLQIQSDALDAELLAQESCDGQQGSSGSSDPSNFNGTPSETTSTTATTATSRSMISDSNSTTTNFSSFNNNIGEQLNNSDMSIITIHQQQHYDFESETNGDSNQSAKSVTWNLNTKKLVKLPTLMHNTSTNLSSYHICHPLELLGPASESIACRVSAFIYSHDFSQNQLEAVVMLCKQFDSDREHVKLVYLQAVYLSSPEDQKRLGKSASPADNDAGGAPTAVPPNCASNPASSLDQPIGHNKEACLLKSNDYELITSVTCFVSTLTHCFVYSLHGKKVVRAQTITQPDLCLDLRPDLLNVYLLTQVGLQICSTGICDSSFRYDWSSSSDLNLSFIATDRIRVLTTTNFVILVGSSVNGRCLVEYMEKPDLAGLFRRIVHTVNRCNSISIRSNMLTYLHATAQLALISQSEASHQQQQLTNKVENMSLKETVYILKAIAIMLCKQLLQKKQTNVITNGRIDKAIKHLLDISMCDIAELMKRHLQSSSLQQERLNMSDGDANVDGDDDEEEDDDDDDLKDNCSVDERKFEQRLAADDRCQSIGSVCSTTLGDDDEPIDTDYELINIYLKHAKYSQALLDYIVANVTNEKLTTRIISYMYQHNPRLLIKCAQRYPLNMDDKATSSDKKAFCMTLFVEKLKQLVELDSTGINRATVLFTLAILYNALDEKQKCLAALGQIKPQNHLAITMCSNHELSHSIAPVVQEHHPDVYNLFLSQLAKRLN